MKFICVHGSSRQRLLTTPHLFSICRLSVLWLFIFIPHASEASCRVNRSEATEICLQELPYREELEEGLTRLGAIDQFCIVTDISSEDPPAYKGVGDKESQEYTGELLDFLVKNRAWPYQAGYVLDRVTDSWENVEAVELHKINGVLTKPTLFPNGTKNPWLVAGNSVKFRGSVLKNWLQFRVYSERNEFSPGRIKGLVLMVKDQDGWPIGDFSQQLPCFKYCEAFGPPFSKDENGSMGDIYYGENYNALPCAYTPIRATTHPGMFIFQALDSKDGEGPTEIHATWRFSQSSCNFVTEIHVQALVLDDLGVKKSTSERIKHEHVLAWAPLYNILYPTKDSVGSWDHVDVEYHEAEVRKRSHVYFCHMPLQKSHGFIVGKPPASHLDIGSNYKFMLSLSGVFKGDWRHYYGQHPFPKAPICRKPVIHMGFPPILEELLQTLHDFLNIPSIGEFLQDGVGAAIRCPCPSGGGGGGGGRGGGGGAGAGGGGGGSRSSTYMEIEPDRILARLVHSSHMVIAWTFLVPLAIFVSRFFKENWVLLFCCQEYWWYMWHVILLFVALVFILGPVIQLRARDFKSQLENTPLIISHAILGYFSIAVFSLQLILGFFRFENPKLRRWQICAHWATGCLNFLLAFALIIAMAFQPETGASCRALYIVIAWFIYFLVMMLIMEVDLHYVDKKHLRLNPKRSYMPPPVKRLFINDAPHRKCRCVMLGLFIGGLILFNVLLCHAIWASDGNSCIQELEGTTKAGPLSSQRNGLDKWFRSAGDYDYKLD